MNTMRNNQRGPSSGRGFFLRRTRGVRFKIVLCMVILALAVGGTKLYGQGVGISEISITPDASAILEVRSVQRGLLIPRMTTAERTAILAPAQGLLVYDSQLRTFWYYDAGWKMVPASLMGGPNQLLGMNAAGTANEYKTLSGTLNQVNVTNAAGLITLSTPQDIHTGASPTFSGLTLTNPLTVPSGGTGLNSITTNNLIYGNGAGAVNLLAPGASNGSVLTTSATGAPQWRTLDLFPATAGILPIANGGTNSGTALIGSSIMVSNGSAIIQGDKGTTVQVLHGNALGLPAYGPVNLTTDVSQILPVVNGGTGQGAPLVPGGVLYGSTAIAAGTTAAGNAGQMLRSTGAGMPIWSTPTYPNSANLNKLMIGDGTNWIETQATYPSSTTINELLYSSANNTITGLPTLNSGVLVTTAAGVPQWTLRSDFTSSALNDGHIYVGNAFNVATDVPMSGDATIINTGALTVGRINGATVPVSGGLTTGNVLQVSGASSLTYGPISLAGGNNFVTGILPVPNGGTGINTLTNHGVLIGQGINPVAVTGTGNAGQVLQSRGNLADPSYSSAIYPTSTTINQILYSSANDNITGIPTANFGVLVTNGTGVPSILSLLPNAVQDNITRLGIITLGTWNGSLITGQYGGTGVNNGTNTITLGGNLATTGAFNTTFNVTGNTTVTLPTVGVLTTLDGTETLTNKTIAAGSNTITGLTNANLSGTAAITNANLANPSLTIGATNIALGATAPSLSGLTLVTSTNFAGDLTGNVTGNVSGTASNVTGIVSPVNGGTGVANNAASTLTIAGNFGTTLTVGAATSLTLPTTGTLATLDGTETFTNKTISAGSNTISGLTNANLSGAAGITNANLATPSLTIGTTNITLGTTTTTLDGTETFTNKTISAGSNTISGLTNANLSGAAGITNANLATPSLTIGTTNIALGTTTTTLAGLTSVTSTNFSGDLSGNVNGVTMTSLPIGFSVTGGTVSATLSVPSSATVTGSNSGDVTVLGENYLSLALQAITANPINLSGSNATGILAAARFPALTGDVTTAAGAVATTISNNAVTYAKIQNLSSFSRLLGSSDASNAVTEITLGSGLTMTGNTLTASGFGGTVTSFSSGNLVPLFTTSVATSTTTPALSFTLSNAAAWSIFGNLTGAAAPPQFYSPTSFELSNAITDETGTGSFVLANTPTLITPVLGNATATTINKVAITAPATGSTLTISEGKTFTSSNTLTFAGTDGSTLNIGTGGALGSNAYTSTAYAPIASPTFTGTVTIPTPFTLGATSVTATGTELNYVSGVTSSIQTQLNSKQGTLTNSAGLAAALNDETGTGLAVFSTNPVLTTPNIGAATATSVNKVTITAPATSSTLTIADGQTLTVTGSATIGGGNHSGTNTGDETAATIRTKLGTASGTTDGYLTSVDWNVFNNKQGSLGYTPEDVANKVTTISGASTNTQYPSAKLTYDQLALKAATDQTFFLGTTSIPINRASGAIVLTGITSIDGNAATATSAVNVTGTVAIANGGTGQTTKAAAFNALSPITTLGDLIYGSAANTSSRLAGNTTVAPMFLKQTGDGVNSAAPVWSALSKADVGLGNVDNTSDANKPISTATQTALNLKSPIASPTFTGTVTIPTPFTLGATSVTATGTELNYVSGVTSSIQTQLNSKQTTVLNDGRILVGNALNVATAVLPTGDVTITNAGVTAIGAGKVTNTMLAGDAVTTAKVLDGTLTNNDLNALAGVQFSKLESLTSGNILVGSAGNVATQTAMTGDISISNAGVTLIGAGAVTTGKIQDGTILNADISNSTIDLTTKVTGALPIVNGGTNNATLGITNGGVIYADGTRLQNTGAGSSGQILRSAGAGPPVWSTATYPLTTTINRLLYSSAANTISDLATANNGILVTSGTGVPSIGNTVGAALTMPSINLSASSNQLVLQSGGITGTMSWTPTGSNKTIIFPDASGTVALVGTGSWNIGGNSPGFPGSWILGTNDNSSLNIQSGTGAINLGADASAKTISIGNVTGTTAVNINTGTTGSTYTTTNGTFNLNTGTGTINLGTDAVQKTINIGNTTGTTGININSGSGAVDINAGVSQVTNINTGISTGAVNIANGGTGGNAVSIGNVNANTSITQRVGTGNFILDGVGASTYTIGNSTVGGTLTIGGTAQTGAITLGSSTAAQTLNLGIGAGAATVNIATGITNAKTINIGTGAVANTISIGGTGANTIDVGDSQTAGIISLGGNMTTGTISIGGASQTGDIDLGFSTAANTLNIGTGSGAASVNIGTGNTNSNLTVGSGGAQITSIITGSANTVLLSVTGRSNTTQSYAVPGAKVGATVIVTPSNPITTLGLFMNYARVIVAGSVEVGWNNPQNFAQNLTGGQQLNFLVINH